MPGINNESDYLASAKQDIQVFKSNIATVGAAQGWWSFFQGTGNPGAGTLSTLGAATTGSVPTDSVAGFPTINAFGGSAKGYITNIDFGSTVACRAAIDDVLWSSASISTAAVATTNFSSQPSYSARLPGGDYKGTRLFLVVIDTKSDASTASLFFIASNRANRA